MSRTRYSLAVARRLCKLAVAAWDEPSTTAVEGDHAATVRDPVFIARSIDGLNCPASAEAGADVEGTAARTLAPSVYDSAAASRTLPLLRVRQQSVSG